MIYVLDCAVFYLYSGSRCHRFFVVNSLFCPSNTNLSNQIKSALFNRDVLFSSSFSDFSSLLPFVAVVVVVWPSENTLLYSVLNTKLLNQQNLYLPLNSEYRTVATAFSVLFMVWYFYELLHLKYKGVCNAVITFNHNMLFMNFALKEGKTSGVQYNYS